MSEHRVPSQDHPAATTAEHEVVAPDGTPVEPPAPGDEGEPSPVTVIEEPAKVMRIGTMIKKLLEEVRNAPLDEAARTRLAEIHERSLDELTDGLSEDLQAELHRITLPFSEDSAPSEPELRVAQAQLVGWLVGCSTGFRRRWWPSRWPCRPN